MQPLSQKFPTTRVKLIFNPTSGESGEASLQLIDVLSELQDLNFVPEVYIVKHGFDLIPVIQAALHQGIHMFVVCGGDGTIDTVGGALAGTRATLGIIPTGTQNNIALSLGIPGDIPAAIAILRTGRRVKVDVGVANCAGNERPFLEACSVGLLSALFPAADDIQHGNLVRIGDLLATLVSFPPAELHLILDTQREISVQGHVVLVTNMPYIGPHYQIASSSSLNDGLLDILVFANLSKLDLLNYAVQIASGGPEDHRIQHYHVCALNIDTHPPMPVLVDGFTLGEGSVQIRLRRRALTMIAGDLKHTDEIQPNPIVVFESEPDKQ
jgi:diacylglycerol kinase (ATP)